MPLTPYHFGPVLLLGILLFPFVDLATIMVASVIVDLEPLAVLLLDLPMPLHGFFHTYLGASIAAVTLSLVVYPLRKNLNKVVSLFGLHQASSYRHIIVASFIGTYSHVLLDSFLYSEMNPFYPIFGNPFVGMFLIGDVYIFCLIAGAVGFVAYAIRVVLKPRVSDAINDHFT